VSRRGDQGPKTIDQIHKDAEQEEHREQMKVQQALTYKKDPGPGGRMGEEEEEEEVAGALTTKAGALLSRTRAGTRCPFPRPDPSTPLALAKSPR